MREVKRLGPAWKALLIGTACSWGLPQICQAEDGTVVHTLRRGDTVWEISSRHGVDPRAIEHLNHLGDVRTLPVGLRLVLPAPPGSAEDSSTPARQALAEALWALRRARFEEALEAAELGRSANDTLEPSVRHAALGAQLDLTSASAELAFGRREAALAHLVSALRLEPRLALDVATTSPKILSLLEEARENAQQAGGGHGE
jgi:LysM repeat protein